MPEKEHGILWLQFFSEEPTLERHIMHIITRDLVYLDIIPLLCSLQCLQVVTGKVIVHQLSSPLGNFLLNIIQYRRFTYSISVYNQCVWVGVWGGMCLLSGTCLSVYSAMFARFLMAYPEIWKLAHIRLHAAHGLV